MIGPQDDAESCAGQAQMDVRSTRRPWRKQHTIFRRQAALRFLVWAPMSADPYRKQRIFWFVTMNLIAMAVAGALFFGFMHGDILDVIFGNLISGLFEYKLVVVLIAMSPLFASLLVGMAYAQRALKRKKGQRATAAPSTAG